MLAASVKVLYTKNMNNQYYIEQLQPYIFGDIGYVNKQNSTTTVSHIESAGGGFRIKFVENIDFGGSFDLIV